jgi:putative ABC transport system permease protein
MQAIAGSTNWSTTVTGSTNDYLQVRNWRLTSGRQFSEGELRGGSAQCIVGATVRTRLFGSQDPLGATIRLQKLSCQVIGVLAKKGQSSFGMDQDDVVLVPLRMLQRRVAGNVDVSMISVSARDGVSTEKVQQDIEQLLRERRRITPGKDDDFHVRNMQQLISIAGTTQV